MINRSFIRWAGSKKKLIPVLTKYWNSVHATRYIEPFAGSAALFFAITPQECLLADMNEELINLYQVVRDNVDELIADLQKHDISKEYFMEIRNIDRTDEYKNWSDIQKASRFIYLNRTCFNGMYRVNSQGQFNNICN